MARGVLIVEGEGTPRGMNEWSYEIRIVVMPPEYRVPGVPLNRIVLVIEDERPPRRVN
jgi:hypothetical protein